MWDYVIEAANFINQNRIFWGVSMITMNMGSRYVIGETTATQETFLKTAIVKKFILFCMCFMATRDITYAAILAFVISLTIHGLLNETCRYNIIPEQFQSKPQNARKQITQEEYNAAKQKVDLFEAQKQGIEVENLFIEKLTKTDAYYMNINKLKQK